jgi:hypothetical protein
MTAPGLSELVWVAQVSRIYQSKQIREHGAPRARMWCIREQGSEYHSDTCKHGMKAHLRRASA